MACIFTKLGKYGIKKVAILLQILGIACIKHTHTHCILNTDTIQS